MASGSVHLVLGYSLGARSPNVAVAIVVGAGSHAALDVLPHRDLPRAWMHGIDLAAGCAAVVALDRQVRSRRARLRGWIGAASGALPDAENVLPGLRRLAGGRPLFPTHGTPSRLPHPDASPFATALTSMGVAALALVLVRNGRARTS